MVDPPRSPTTVWLTGFSAILVDPIGDCCSMTSDTKIAYGSWVSLHGRSTRFRLYQAKISSSIWKSLAAGPAPKTGESGRAKAAHGIPPDPQPSRHAGTFISTRAATRARTRNPGPQSSAQPSVTETSSA